MPVKLLQTMIIDKNSNASCVRIPSAKAHHFCTTQNVHILQQETRGWNTGNDINSTQREVP